MNVKLNDNVLVITGKYAGKQGKVIATSPKSGKVTVEGINIQHKTQKARRGNDVSKIVEKEGAIDVSNVMVVCPACDKAVAFACAPSAAPCSTRHMQARRARKSRKKSPKSAPESARQRPKPQRMRRKTRLSEKVNEYGKECDNGKSL